LIQTHQDDTLRRFLALTVAVLTETEHAFRAIAPKHPTQWESLERSANVFTDEHVIKWLAENNPDMQRAVAQHRRRKVMAGAGTRRVGARSARALGRRRVS
jgi:hypothetical protein